jgi:hypothetical protein
MSRPPTDPARPERGENNCLKDNGFYGVGRCLGPAALLLVLAACQPTVKVEAPDKPITINLNVHIEQEVRIKVEKEADQLLNEKKDLF